MADEKKIAEAVDAIIGTIVKMPNMIVGSSEEPDTFCGIISPSRIARTLARIFSDEK